MGWRRAAVLTLLCLGVLVPGPSYAADPTVSFVGGATVTMSAADPSTRLQNDTTRPRSVTVKLDFDQSTPQPIDLHATLPSGADITLSSTRTISVPAAGSTRLTLGLRGEGQRPIAGTIIAVDLTSKSVLRQTFTIPATTSRVPITWEPDVSVAPLGTPGKVNVGSLPLGKGTRCVDVAPGQPATLVNGDDDATLTATCKTPDSARLHLSVRDLNSGRTGAYKGTLKVGGTDVAVTVTRHAPLYWAILVLLAGAFVALLARAIVTKVPIYRAKSAASALKRPLATPTTWIGDDKAHDSRDLVEGAASKTAQGLLESLTSTKLFGRGWRWISFLLAPSDMATKTVTDTGAKTNAAEATVAAWEATCVTIAELDLPRSSDGPLTRRAQAIKNGHGAADEPVKNTRRAGLTGVQALIDEVDALTKVKSAAVILDEVADQLNGHLTEHPPYAEDSALADSLHQRWVVARVELHALQQFQARATDARDIAEDLTTRATSLSKQVDRLVGWPDPVPPAPRDGRVTTPDQLEATIRGLHYAAAAPMYFALSWPTPGAFTGGDFSAADDVVEALKDTGRALATGGRRLADTLVVLLALAGVVLAGLVVVYFDHTWGTPRDLLVTFLAAATGATVLAPLITVVDQLRGAKDDLAAVSAS